MAEPDDALVAQHTALPVTDLEALARVLPDQSLASSLLTIWTEGDPTTRIGLMAAAAQPQDGKVTDVPSQD